MSAAEILFGVFAATACGAAIAVVASRNVVRMAFWLIVSLGATAGLFFALHADFVGATQLLVYVGGTLVLLIFGVMLTASGPFLSLETSYRDYGLAAIFGGGLLVLILGTACSLEWATVSPPASVGPLQTIAGQAEAAAQAASDGGQTTAAIGFSLLGLRPDRDLGAQHERLSVGYLLPFEIVSVHLLVVLVGAAYLARAKRRVAD